jgi:hypothetical protein
VTERLHIENVGHGTALVELMLGQSVEVVGIEDLPDGAVKVYIGQRWRGIYCIAEAGDAADAIRREWSDPSRRLLIPRPPDSAIGQDAQ